MLEADQHLTQMAMESGNRFVGDESVYAQFLMKAREIKSRSAQEGRPIYEDQPYVRIMVPGDKDNVITRPVREADKHRFPRQWQAFQANMEQPMEGTPLANWPAISPAMVSELAFFGVKTVEALDSMPDSQAQKFMGINALKAKARSYLEAAAGMAPTNQLRAENEALRQELAELRSMVGELTKPAQAEPIEDKQPRRRRRASEG